MKKQIITASILCLISSTAYLAAQDVPDTPAQPDAVAVKASAAPASPVAKTNSDLINVNFPNNEIRNILRSVAELKDLNVVIPDTIVGKMSIKLSNVTWQQVFEVVLDPIGFTYVQDGNIIKIRSIKDLLAEPMQTRVYLVNYAKAAELCPAITPIVENNLGGRAIVDTRTNAIVVTERSSRLRQIEDIIKRLDRPNQQVMIESKFIELTQSNEKAIGLNWSNSMSLSASGVSKTYTTTYDNITGTDPTLTDEYNTVDTAVLSASDFSLVMEALNTNDKIEMVSNPTIVTMNNVAANMHIGKEYPIPNYQYNEEKGTYEINGFEYKKLGISMDVTPQINNNGMINLVIKPEVSDINGYVTFTGASGMSIPIITQRKTSSTITLKSGYTLAIGGLVESTREKYDTKIPGLGSIPFLGRLFREDADTGSKRNLVIFITAKILDAEGSTYKDVLSKQNIMDMGLTDSAIPGYEMNDTENDLYNRIQNAREKASRTQNEDVMRGELNSMYDDKGNPKKEDKYLFK
jgi:type IV pilus assembly protein PilQ